MTAVAEITNGIRIPKAQPHFIFRYARLSLIEARPTVQIVFLLRYALGAAFSTRQHGASPAQLAAGTLAWWLAVIAAYLINGVMDVKEDRANGSVRPIARGDLPERPAAFITAGTALGALALAQFVPGLTLWIAAFLLLGWIYSAPPFPAKRWSTACALVVFGLGWTSFAGGAATAGGELDTAGLVFATVMSAWMAMVGSVVKDLSDVDGDATGGRRTVAVRYGARPARALGAAGALSVGTAAVLAALLWAPSILVAMVPVAVGAVCVVTQIVRTARVDNADKRTRRSAYRAFMRTQYTANLVMVAVLLLDRWPA
ncbi:homogenitisate phytyltransferase [Streptomyces actuosus]|uniref:Homogenitisate phytyltransferase n=1 Tax=Streptomyces actuosus TaxID=1885 RepID=A0A2U9P3U4_STRAS|nr:homogenitisate phytyltransferase [Streptomyces actuosus]